MNFTRTDANALLAIALGSAIGMATLGPQAWLANELTTTTTTTYTTYGAATTRTDVEVVTVSPDPAVLQPVIYVDGVRFEGALPDLDPDDIERIEVVKGEAARQPFGPEAALGVVQIFLKEPASSDPGA